MNMLQHWFTWALLYLINGMYVYHNHWSSCMKPVRYNTYLLPIKTFIQNQFPYMWLTSHGCFILLLPFQWYTKLFQSLVYLYVYNCQISSMFHILAVYIDNVSNFAAFLKHMYHKNQWCYSPKMCLAHSKIMRIQNLNANHRYIQIGIKC